MNTGERNAVIHSGMEEFINKLDIGRFESTNGLWNELMLNDPWSVGYVTRLIETNEFRDKEEWENYYYNSGKERERQLLAFSPDIREKLDDEQLVRRNKTAIQQMGWNLRNLNFNYGRTIEQISRKGKILFETARSRGIAISESECVEAVRFRTICQTWNGVIIRERKTIDSLRKSFPTLSFRKTDGDFDYEYAVDYQLFLNDSLICGIQIKPASYANSEASYVLNAKAANKRKNDNYTNHFGVPVFDIIFERGEIQNPRIKDCIKELLP